MRGMSIITDYIDKLRKIEAHLDEIEENCDKNYAEAVDALDDLKEKAEEYAEPIWDYEDHLFYSDMQCTPEL